MELLVESAPSWFVTAMRVVALEEHFTVPDLVQRIDPNAISRRGFRSRKPLAGGPNAVELLSEIGERRLQSMDEAGIAVQVLSNSGPGPDLVPGPDGIGIARAMNDLWRQPSPVTPNVLRGSTCCQCRALMPRLSSSFVRLRTLVCRCAHQRHDRGPPPRSPEL
jgi:hypothetical protein